MGALKGGFLLFGLPFWFLGVALGCGFRLLWLGCGSLKHSLMQLKIRWRCASINLRDAFTFAPYRGAGV